MTPQEIYEPLRRGGLSRAGALGAIGNFMAEAGPELRPNRVQIGTTSLTDEQYTRAVDQGRIDFEDGRGYGLAQWTMGKRKNWLLSFAKKSNVSVGDGPMQVAFFLWECREYFPNVWKVLTESEDVSECADIVCRVYENPAVKNYPVRRSYAMQAAEQTWDEPAAEAGGDLVVKLLQLAMAEDGYWPRDQISGEKTPAFRAKIIEYAADVAKT